jgi:hypothetical protein
VETTSFRQDDGVIFQNADPVTFRITERFTRANTDTLNYEFTIEGPHTWSPALDSPHSLDRHRSGQTDVQYACDEDNYDLVHFFLEGRVAGS